MDNKDLDKVIVGADLAKEKDVTVIAIMHDGVFYEVPKGMTPDDYREFLESTDESTTTYRLVKVGEE